MKTYLLLLMCGFMLITTVACNLSTSAGTSIELTEVAQDLTPTTTPTQPIVPTETSTPQPTVTTIVPNSPTQIPPTAVLPPVTLPLLDAPGIPLSTECSVTPSQPGTLVNVRRGAELGYEAFFQLKTYATVTAFVNGWYQIPLDGGLSGFVSDTVTKLYGDCAFLFPTPIPDRDPTVCYLDIPMMLGDEIPYFNEPQPQGSQKQGDMASFRLAIQAEKAGWYDVINYQNDRGWVPASMGSTSGACENITKYGYDTPICLIVAHYDGNAYYTPFTGTDRFGTVPAGIALGATAKTSSGWYGFDPGIAQAPKEGLDRLRWVYPNHTNVFNTVGNCDAIPVVYDNDADWDYAISNEGEPPTDVCYLQSIAPAYTNFIFTGIETPEVIGVLNTYARFVSFGDLGHVIQVADDVVGWVSRDKVQFVGEGCPVT